MENSKVENAAMTILMDFSTSSYIALRYAALIAKKTGEKITLFHIGNPTEIISSDNQSSAIREFNDEIKNIENKLNAIVDMLSTENINVDYEYSFGNTSDELKSFVKRHNPKLFFLGKKSKSKFQTSKITNILLNELNENLFFVHQEEELDKQLNLCFSSQNGDIATQDIQTPTALFKRVEGVTSFVNIRKQLNNENDIKLSSLPKAIEGMDNNFQLYNIQSDSYINSLNGFITENKINVLCIGKDKKSNGLLASIISRKSATIDIIEKVKIPVLVMRDN